MRIILSSRNISKAKQIRAALTGLSFEVLTLDDVHIMEGALEDGATLEENALKKARFAWEKTRSSKSWTIADDTGFFIDALGGRPGIHAARWAGENVSTEDIMNFTLKKLEGVPAPKRGATFKTVAAVLSPEGDEHLFSGEVRGTILEKPRTVCQPNMPYSAIFLPDGLKKVWAEMATSEENMVSHRGKAFRQVREFFEKL